MFQATCGRRAVDKLFMSEANDQTQMRAIEIFVCHFFFLFIIAYDRTRLCSYVVVNFISSMFIYYTRNYYYSNWLIDVRYLFSAETYSCAVSTD